MVVEFTEEGVGLGIKARYAAASTFRSSCWFLQRRR
jgi:hypothetical protein